MDLAIATAAELVAALRARRVSSVELVEGYLRRIDRLNPTVNAVVHLDADRALDAARRADAAWAAGRWLGPLHGLPMTVKDALDTAGLTTTGGSADHADRVPDRDAEAVARLRADGAVVLGKTNLPPWSGDLQTWSALHGATHNPWDLTRAPGGSSGGAAVAVACGLTSLETGTDIGGSIRNPASFTGVYGHKPSFGLVPDRGYFDRPGGGVAPVDINCVGPIGRSVDDLGLSLASLAGPDTFGGPRVRFDAPEPRLSGRVGLWLDDGPPVDPAVRGVLEAAVERLIAAGVAVEPGRPQFDWRADLWDYHLLLGAAVASGMPEGVRAAGRGHPPADGPVAGESPFDASLRGMAGDAAARTEADARRHRTRHGWAEWFAGGHDALLCPVTPTAALPTEPGRSLAERTVTIDGEVRPAVEAIAWCGLIGHAGLPSTVIPVGATADGLPVGVQVVAPYLQDTAGLQVARRLDAVLGAFRVPPLALG